MQGSKQASHAKERKYAKLSSHFLSISLAAASYLSSKRLKGRRLHFFTSLTAFTLTFCEGDTLTRYEGVNKQYKNNYVVNSDKRC